MEKTRPKNPWLRMWIHPRRTIREIVDYHVNYRILLLITLCGAVALLPGLTSLFNSLVTVWEYPLLPVLLLGIIFAFPIGYLWLNLLTFLYRILGKLLKGKGSFQEIRCSLCWSNLPSLVMGAIWVLAILCYGGATFNEGTTVGQVLKYLQYFLAIWGCILFLHALGEVQGFSAWKALLNLILVGVIIILVVTVIAWICIKVSGQM